MVESALASHRGRQDHDGQTAGDVLLVPEPFRASSKAAIEAADDGAERYPAEIGTPLMVLVGEIKEQEAGAGIVSSSTHTRLSLLLEAKGCSG